MEDEARFLKRAVKEKVLDPDKGTAALYIYSQLKQRGVRFSFGEFLVERGLLTSTALQALEMGPEVSLRPVSTLGDFQLLRTLGEGQNGTVFLALQQSLQRHVALKVLRHSFTNNTEGLKHFVQEARATARINHPNVVQGIDVGSDQGLHYFAMELVDGGSARGLMERHGGRLPESLALNVTRQIAEGLKAAHAMGMLHRDIKPDNILLTQDGQAKLADLGISQAIGEAERGEGSGVFWGSPPYVAPEIIRGGSDNDPRSDIYSLGATLFELLAGRPPFQGETPEEILQHHLGTPVPDLAALRPDVSVQLIALIRRMLVKEMAERVPSAAAVSEALGRLLDRKAAPPPPPPRPVPAPAPAAAQATRRPIAPPTPRAKQTARPRKDRPPGRR